MYNLLVQYAPWEGGTATVPTGRLFEYTDKALEERFHCCPNKAIEQPCNMLF